MLLIVNHKRSDKNPRPPSWYKETKNQKFPSSSLDFINKRITELSIADRTHDQLQAWNETPHHFHFYRQELNSTIKETKTETFTEKMKIENEFNVGKTVPCVKINKLKIKLMFHPIVWLINPIVNVMNEIKVNTGNKKDQ